ncbi:S1 family peptidase [Brevibacillus borstelensis]|uniref:S1 family peptidase n=1 Tax=Brevibacillus borstelensis TaxID=45462 RepID=UPI0030C3437A
MKKLRKSLIATALLATLVTTLSIPATSTIAAQKHNPEALQYIMSEEAIKESERFREEMGLSSSSKTVKSLSKSPQNFSEKYGAFLTKEEEDELDARLAEQKKRIPKIKDFIEENLQEEFAGIYIDQKSGGVVNIGFKNGSEEKVERYIKDLEKLYSKDLINIYYTDYTEEELNEIADSISESRETLEKEGMDITSVSVNIPDKKIDIGVKRKKTDGRKILLKQKSVRSLNLLDADDSIFNIFEEDVRDVQADPSDYFRPIQAGLQIINMESGGTCTSAFSARIGREFYVLTAGHCVDDERDRFQQGRSRFGRVADFNFGGSVDAALIELDEGSDDATYYVFGNGKSKLYAIDEVQRTRDETVGDAVCVSGSKTGRVKCGTLEKTNWNGYIEKKSKNQKVYMTGMRLASFSSIPGDSGAPIFLGGTAIGVNCAAGGVYTHISRVINYFDIDDIFTGN